MPELSTKYPWLDIIRFHRDFVQLEQENFFQIPLNEKGIPNPAKCLAFIDLSPDSIDAEWSVPDGPGSAIIEEIKTGNIAEGYIGGPCWSGSSQSNGRWIQFVSPFFYQHATVKYEREKHLVTFTPDEGRWEISPIVFNRLERSEFAPDVSFEELPFAILEHAYGNGEKNSRTFSESLIEEIITRLPPLASDFRNSRAQQNSFFGKNQNPWIFFVPPSAENSYVKYIMPDYLALEQRLLKKPSDIGGLKIFENRAEQWVQTTQQADLVPVVPLNASQERAVKHILDTKPVTVISGPPGCGKSQVVVSLLVNAWKDGKTVLFASTTKAAVDVVYDRLKEFDCDYPIAVRAGAKDRNTIESSLERLQHLTMQGRYSAEHNRSIGREIEELSAKKQDYQQFLNNKIPQRITQAKQAASRAFLDFRTTTEKIARNRDIFQKQAELLGYPLPINQFGDRVCAPLLRWWDAREICLKTIERDEALRTELSEKIAICEHDRDILLDSLGCTASNYTSFSWLTSGPGPDRFGEWLVHYRALLDDDIERYYSLSSDDVYKKWNSESDARSWIDLSGDLLRRIDTLVNINRERFSRYRLLNQYYEALRAEILQEHLSLKVTCTRSSLVRWKQANSEYISLPDGIMSFLKRRGAENQLRRIEKELATYFPAGIWSGISRDPIATRRTLDGLVDKTLRWLDVSEEWENSPDRQQTDDECRQIKEIRKTLHLQNFIVNYQDDLSFVEISRKIRELEPIAREAAETWCLRNKKEQFLRDLKTLIFQFDRFVINSPIVNAWAGHEGRNLADIFGQLKDRPAFELIATSMNYCSADRFVNFLETWGRCCSLQKSIDEYIHSRGEIPNSRERISGWWEDRPAISAIQNGDTSTLPGEGSVLHRHLVECAGLRDRWQENCRTELNELETIQRSSFAQSIRDLTVSYDNIPVSMRDEPTNALFLSILAQPMEGARWISDDDEILFNKFNPERIQASIHQLNSQLTGLSFTLAKEMYLKRIAEGSYVLESVDKLRRYLKRSSSFKARDFPRDEYLNALAAVPIWVTNAHQTQSFPMEPDLFDILVIDEASQCTLTNMLPLIYRAKSLGVIGDPNQLPAIFRDSSQGKEQALAQKYGISDYLERFGHRNITLFQTGMSFLPGGRKNMINLVEHYRSHPLIIGFSNLYIYQMRLSLRKPAMRPDKPNTVSGVFGLDVPGECFRDINGKSWVNVREAHAICDIIKEIRTNDEFGGKSIGIVTPFKGQKEKIQEILSGEGLFSSEILVGTVDTFQGNERDIMFFSPVLSKGITPAAAEWSDDKNRINVALTRARDLMVVVGDFAYCKNMDTILGNLIAYVSTISLLRQTSDAELELFSLMILEGNTLNISRENLPQVHQRIGAIEVDFVLRNPEKGVNLVIEVDGAQHYYVEIGGDKYPVRYEGIKKYVEIAGKNREVQSLRNSEFVNVENKSLKVIRTNDSIQTDKGRDEFLKTEGYKILRIPYQDIFEKPDVVMQDIKEKLEITRDSSIAL